MGKRKSPCGSSSKRERNREILFTALLKMSENLAGERRILEDKVKSLNAIIHKMQMKQKYESLKRDHMFSLKERDAFFYKHRCDCAHDQLADFRNMLSLLSQKYSDPKEPVLDEITRLKSELEKIQLEKTSEVTALLDEKNFIWNQYNKMESDFTERLKNKSSEVEQANERMKALINKAEESECSNERLRTDLAKAEYESSQKTNEISRLLKEIEVLKSRSESETPVLRPCKATRGSTSTSGALKAVDKVSHPSNTEMPRVKPIAHKSTGGKAPKKQLSVRERGDISIPDSTPKLFSSSFKVPKLKHSSSRRK